jgi:(S)-citramalyl-CoA lyase
MTVRQRRATLFVGGLVLDALRPALESGADIVCIDLEDAVPSDRKDEARAAVVAALPAASMPPGVQVAVRVNTVRTPEGRADIDAILSHAPSVGALMLPKVDSAEDILDVSRAAARRSSPVELYAIIETAPGLERSAEIAAADGRLKALFFGGFDLSTALGCAMAWEPLLYARSRVVHAGALGGIEVIDSPFADVNDLEGLGADCVRIRALGMAGKCAKHATQVATILEAFTPTAAEIERARRIVALFRADPVRPLVFDGKLIELPAIKRLERLAAMGA